MPMLCSMNKCSPSKEPAPILSSPTRSILSYDPLVKQAVIADALVMHGRIELIS